MSVNGLNKITEKILTEAQAEADRILAEAQAQCDELAADYNQKADAIRERLSVSAQQKGEDMISRAKAASAMKKRDLLLQQRSDLVDSVFTGAKEWILGLPTEKYADLLAGLLAAALIEISETEASNLALYGEEEEKLPEQCQIRFNKKDREACGETVLELLRKKLKGKIPDARLEGLSVSGALLDADGGAVLCCGEIEVNCTFELLFAELQRELEGEVNSALFEIRGTVR